MSRHKGQHLLGVKTRWDGAERLAVASHSSSLWRRLKRRNGWDKIPLREIPGFVDSLQSLHDQGYSASDIAAFFGVSRERGRQWFNECGIERNGVVGSMVRVWDDELNRFTAVSPSRLNEMIDEIHEKVRTRAQRERAHGGALKCDADVELLKELNRKLGRPPYRVELLREMGVTDKPAEIARYITVSQRWGWSWRDSDGISYAEAWDKMYSCAGMVRKLGTGITEAARHNRDKYSVQQIEYARWLRHHEGRTYSEISEMVGATNKRSSYSMVNHRYVWEEDE